MYRAGEFWLPENETPRHWALKWIGWYALTHLLDCFVAGVEVNVYRYTGEHEPYARQDVVGLRKEYRYIMEPTMLVKPERLTTWKWDESGAREEDGARKQTIIPWIETGRPGKVRKSNGDWVDGTAYQTWGVSLDGETNVEVVNSNPNKNGEVRVRPLGKTRIEQRLVYGVDAKQSRGDFAKWKESWQDRVAALDYAVIVAPVGLLKPDELPEGVGLIECDPSKFEFAVQDAWGPERPTVRLRLEITKAPERLQKVREITDQHWMQMQLDCWQSQARTLERYLHHTFWQVVKGALTEEGQNVGGSQ